MIYNLFELDISKHTINDRLIKLSISDPLTFLKEVNENSLIYSLNSVREISNHLVFKSNQNGIFILDKASSKLYWNKFDSESYMFSSAHYYPHDGDDEKIMFILPAYEYLRYTNSPIMRAEGFIEVNEDDNPILIFFKEKPIVVNAANIY